jgi:subtilisin family serine protease
MPSIDRKGERMKARLLSVAMVLSLLVVVFAAAGAAAERRAVSDALFQQASSAGSARVIVRLNAPFSPDAAMVSAAHAAVQRQDIAAVRSALKAQLAASRHTVVREYDALPFLVLEAGPDALALLEALTGLVASVEEDRIHHPQLGQSVPLVQAPQAWTAGFDGSGTIVAVLDTGVQKTHPFLSGKVIAEACFSSNTTNAGHVVTSLCPGAVTSSTASGSGVNCAAAIRGCDHGTHVAGIVAGGTTGAAGAGVAPGAGIMAIQVFSSFPAAHPSCGGVACALSFSSDQIAALNHVFNQRNAFPAKTMASVNMSLGGGEFTAACTSDPLVTPIAQLKTAGIATVIASGNNGFTDAMSSPGCAPGAVSVGSTGDGSLTGAPLDVVSSFSNMVSFVSLVAPGQWIRSSVPTTTDPTGFANFAGTSMATPHVAGAFAVLREGNPTASVDTLLQALQSTGPVVTDTRAICGSCVSTGVTSRRINVMAALNAVAVPDVAVTAATTVASATAGQAIVVDSTVTNLGPTTVGPFTVGYYLSTTTVLDGAEVFLAERTVTSLAAAASNVVPSTVTVPAGTAPGTYRILVMADSGGVLAESNESNNVSATAALVIVGPDVTVTAATTVATAAPGGSIVVNSTIKNIGAAAAGSFTVRYYLSTDALFDGADVLVGGRTVTSLAAGAQDTTPKTVVVPAGTAPRRYRLLVVADATNTLAESNESNNVRATTSIAVGPDVTVTAATTVATAAPGDAIVVESTITTLGSAAGSFTVRYYLSTDAVFDGADVLVGGRTVSSLAAGAQNTTPKTVVIPAGTAPSRYRLLVVADATNTLVESDESNNVRATLTIVVGPDVTVTAPSTVATASPGAGIAVNSTITNLGSAAGSFIVRYYLSADAVFDGGDVLVGGRAVTSLAAGAVNVSPKTVPIPVGTAPGTYRILVRADATDVLMEASETNNVRATAAITIGP